MLPHVRTFFLERYARNFLADKSPRTFQAYLETIHHWEMIIGITPIDLITSEQLADFKTALFQGTPRKSKQRSLFPEIDLSKPAKPLARATVNKHLRAIQAILNKAGPPGYRNRDALGIISSVPWVKPMKEFDPEPRCISLDELAAFYLTANLAKFPKHDPVTWWQSLIIFDYTTAFRKTALFSIEWANLDFINAIIKLPSAFDKCGKKRVKPLHHLAILHLLKLQKNAVNSRVFAWPHGRKTFYKQWHELQDAAGIKEHFTLHDIKRTAGSRLAEISNPWIVQKMLDHSKLETSKSYVNVTNDLRQAVEKLPIPDSMKGFSS